MLWRSKRTAKKRLTEGMVQAHQVALARFVWGTVQDEGMAHDIVQEAFLRLWENESVTTEEHAKRWLYRTCRNLALDRVKQQKRQQVLLTEQTLSAVASGAGPGNSDPQTLVLAAELQSQLADCLSTLPPRQQEVLRLRLQADMTYLEIAVVMETTKSNVGALIHIATKRLRDEIEAMNVNPSVLDRKEAIG